MDATGQVSVAHGLTLSKIRSVNGIIRNDADTFYYSVSSRDIASETAEVQITYIDATNVVLDRAASPGIFDAVAFDSTSYNRGWITIWYTE